jgi:hypothetical protein
LHDALAKCGFYDNVMLELLSAPSPTPDEIDTVFAVYSDQLDGSRHREAAWDLALNHVMISFQYNLEMELSRKRVTKHLIEFFSEHDQNEITQSELYTKPMIAATESLNWYSQP